MQRPLLHVNQSINYCLKCSLTIEMVSEHFWRHQYIPSKWSHNILNVLPSMSISIYHKSIKMQKYIFRENFHYGSGSSLLTCLFGLWGTVFAGGPVEVYTMVSAIDYPRERHTHNIMAAIHPELQVTGCLAVVNKWQDILKWAGEVSRMSVDGCFHPRFDIWRGIWFPAV